MLELLRATNAPVIFSRINWHRAAEPADLSAQFGTGAPSAESVGEALELARERAGRDGIVFVCGSLYLVGEAKRNARQVSGPQPLRA